MNTVIQSISSLGFVPKDAVGKLKRMGVSEKRAKTALKKAQVKTLQVSMRILQTRNELFYKLHPRPPKASREKRKMRGKKTGIGT